MSGYKGHCAFNVLLALPILVGAQFYFMHTKPIFLYVFMGAFVYTTLFMNPDLDLVHNIKLMSVRGFFSIPFRAYSMIFRHRGISHSFFWGSLTRILWLGGIGLLVFFVVYKNLPSVSNFKLYWKHYKYFFIYALAGICIADWCHLLLDFAPQTGFKKKKY